MRKLSEFPTFRWTAFSSTGYLCGDLAAKSESPRGLRDALVRSLDVKSSSHMLDVSNSMVIRRFVEVHGMSIVDAGIGESS